MSAPESPPPPTVSGWLRKRYFFGLSGQRFCLLASCQLYLSISNPSFVAKDADCQNVDTVFDIDCSTEIKILDGERAPCFSISDSKGQSMVLQCPDVNDMMRWVLLLRSLTFQNNRISMSNFIVHSVLGCGFYGKVMLCENRETHEMVAIKSVHKSKLINSDRVNTIVSERNILTRVEHPFIISMLFAFQTPSKFYFGLEFAAGGELFYHMQRREVIPLEETRLYSAEIALALNHLHEAKIIYRDLKPENILLDEEGHVKLTDFGLSKIISDVDASTSTFCGTTEYLAPEVIRHQPYGTAVDWWALGILVFEMLFGQTPFADENRPKLFQNICKQEPQFPRNADPAAAALIGGLLAKDCKTRFAFADLKKQEFFRPISFENVAQKLVRPLFRPGVRNPRVPENVDAQFLHERALDSFVPPIAGPLIEVSQFSYHRADGVEAMLMGNPLAAEIPTLEIEPASSVDS